MVGLENAVAEDGIDKGTFQHAPLTFPGRSAAGRSLWLAVLLALLGAALGFVVFATGQIAGARAEYALRNRALAALPLVADSLKADVEKQRLIPLILARDGAVQEMFRSPSPAKEAALDDKLRGIARDAMASVVYVINTEGIAVAASNAGEPTRFVGNDYRYRHYFTEAMANGTATQYALGTTSARPGLYLASRVDGSEGPLGVVVVKVEIDRVESSWRESGFVVFTTDERGAVLATSVPQWRFGALSPLSEEETETTRDRLQLSDATFKPVPLSQRSGNMVAASPAGRSAGFVAVSQDLGKAVPGWRLSLLIPADAEISSAAITGRVTTLLALILLGFVVFVIVRRRRAIRQRQEALARMNTELEYRVDLRTADLRRTNEALAHEIAERENAEARVRRLRDELAQANRLSILGQIAAGVAHEINQPVAAIRTYAENAARLLQNGRSQDTAENMSSIIIMTGRIGSITETLRSFSRRATGAIWPLPAEEAIDGALSLLSGRIRDSGVMIERKRTDSSPMVMASRIRLEQILVNLLQNALDALEHQAEPQVEIALTAKEEMVAISVRDNGPGLAPDIRRNLFMPFTTNKEKGLGLGLVISEEIARELGGSLRLDTNHEKGASFTVELRRAA
ncbi:sensor histidine kinase [Microvirga tunisiensis]|uniref:histidine kinase n=1 Tax=Microvirga tunisiensis TaxID=2108360 RepID=A0A5N7MWS1_9HYPH|nr:sensor histidine kinase [Microvirga tunisiensis]MPR13040.1 sensor histidine kinase [Microvirga tunisiensis]MPR30939.1 sensor histidine kinase [Microvirga tunisiensis]